MQETKVITQYIKTLSFEVPDAPQILIENKAKPNVELSINLDARKINQESIYEISLKFGAIAKINENSTLFDLEIIYCGVFDLSSVKQDVLEQVMLIYCPTLLFPYLRKIISDVTSEAGMNPLQINPIDFAKLYNSRKKSANNNSDSLANIDDNSANDN